MKSKGQKLPIETLAVTVTALRANGFESLTEADIFCTAAGGLPNGEPMDLSEICRALKLPISTGSRLVWGLHERGLLEYVPHASDRRRKLVRAKLETFR